MTASNRKPLFLGLTTGIALTAFGAIMMGQGASQPVKSDPQYFVTGGGGTGDEAHLWVREGAAIRVVAHGECKECIAKGHDHADHKEGDGHDHAKPAPKK